MSLKKQAIVGFVPAFRQTSRLELKKKSTLANKDHLARHSKNQRLKKKK